MREHFHAIVVGAGPSGNAAAYTLAKAGLKVLQIERGEYPGSKNVQGAILYADALERIIPTFREDAPLERHVVEQRIWMMDQDGHAGAHYRSSSFNEEKPNRYTIIRAQFDKWFSRQVQAAGALVICETTVTALLRGENGRVEGVVTDRENGVVTADIVILAEGVNGLLGTRAGLRTRPKPEQVALAVKEMHFLPQETIEARFNLKEDEGVVIEATGTITEGMVGTAFIYTNKESLSVGIGCLVSDFGETKTKPYELLDRFKRHSSVHPLIEGAEVKEYAAHLIPEGGYKAIPQLYGDGWLIVGDAGSFVNAAHREGSNLAMTTGRLAAETVIYNRRMGLPNVAENLKRYKDELDRSFVMQDLKKYKHLPETLHTNKQFFTTYPHLISTAAQKLLRVDGESKWQKEKDITAAFLRTRRIGGLITDVFKMARAWR